ncbi:MAG TPA: methylated DNA-protein cysteine methyltransferase [Opitutales bacterium]|nr:methylated DNA-protein cysteine methyltransferase [Opitutales bacterium]
MAYQRKSWREKLADSKGLPKVGRITGRMSRRFGSGTLVVPAPLEVDEVMRAVPKGKLTTIDQIRTALAKKHQVDVACPMCTGIFAWIAAHAAEEGKAAGKKKITPYWRTLKNGGELNQKYPGGAAGLKKLLAAEGHRIIARGKKFFVKDLDKVVI